MKIINFLLNYNIHYIILSIIIIVVIIKNKEEMKRFYKEIKDKFANIWNVFINICTVLIYWFLCYFKLLWFFFVLVIVSIYCCANWTSVINFEPFTGNSLILCLMIFLLIFPLILNFKIGNVEGSFCDVFNFSKLQEKLEKNINKLPQKTATNIDNSEITILEQKVELLKSSFERRNNV